MTKNLASRGDLCRALSGEIAYLLPSLCAPQIVPLRLCSSALAAQLLIVGDSLGTKVAPPERGGAWGRAGVVAGLDEGVQKKKKKKFATLL